MTAITGNLDAALYAVHFWARDMQNHRYLREQVADLGCDFLEPQCTQGRFTSPTKYAFRGELSQELGEDRDRARDCHPCFSTRRRGGA
jgi:hypothetical protein